MDARYVHCHNMLDAQLTLVQHTGALLNFVGFEVIGLPIAIVLAFHFGLGVRGLWLGLLAGLLTQACHIGSYQPLYDAVT